MTKLEERITDYGSAEDDGTVDWGKPAAHSFKTRGHPEANGRIPQPGDVEWKIRLPLEDGTTLEILLGRDDFEHLRTIIYAEDKEVMIRALQKSEAP